MNLSWLKWSLKLQWVCVGRGPGRGGPENIYIKYLNTEWRKLKTVQGVHTSLIRPYNDKKFFWKWNIPLKWGDFDTFLLIFQLVYGHFRFKTAILNLENVRNGFSILNNPQNHSNIVQISKSVFDILSIIMGDYAK